MKSINIYEAKTNFSSLINQIEKSQEKIIILKRGKPIAELIPINKSINRLKISDELKKIKIKYDLFESTETEWENVDS